MTPALLAQIVALIVQFGPLAVNKFLELDGIRNLGPEEKVNVANLIAAAHASNADTIATVEAWKQANGLV